MMLIPLAWQTAARGGFFEIKPADSFASLRVIFLFHVGAIIRAMIKDTPVVLLDEPENHLDITAMEKVKEWIRRSDKTVIYVSHNPEFIACADKEIKLT